MREAAFLKQNKDKWERFERILSGNESIPPAELADLYVHCNDDLAYARTFYPGSKTESYVNDLALKAHNQIYKNKRFDKGRYLRFFTLEVPLVSYDLGREILLSFVLFLVCMLIGALSAHYDDTFARLILGDGYVNMTEANIAGDDPMAVYKKMNEVSMFYMIFVNNVWVATLCFTIGAVLGIGTVWIISSNAIMLGAFQQFFIEKGLFWESFRTVFIHGTIEILTIIIAGAAGLALAKAWMFPGTYKRSESFQSMGRKAFKLYLTVIPLLFIAAFLEAYVTRHTQMPDSLAALIIGGSFIFMIGYFVIYPFYLNRKLSQNAGENYVL